MDTLMSLAPYHGAYECRDCTVPAFNAEDASFVADSVECPSCGSRHLEKIARRCEVCGLRPVYVGGDLCIECEDAMEAHQHFPESLWRMAE